MVSLILFTIMFIEQEIVKGSNKKLFKKKKTMQCKNTFLKLKPKKIYYCNIFYFTTIVALF